MIHHAHFNVYNLLIHSRRRSNKKDGLQFLGLLHFIRQDKLKMLSHFKNKKRSFQKKT